MDMPLAHIEALAAALHANGTDHAGRAYTVHLAGVASRVARGGGDDTTVKAAWLHDAVEDKLTTFAELAAAGVADDVLAVVDVVSRRDAETYAAFIERIATHPDLVVRRRAVMLKLADIADNTDPARVALLTETDPAKAVSLAKRYAKAHARLMVAAGNLEIS